MQEVCHQASVIPFRVRDGEISFCLITTSSGGKWTFPKGTIEPGDTGRQTALKEAFEEAGLHGDLIGEPVGSFQQTKWSTDFAVEVYLMDVTQVDEAWEEQDVRQRRWCDLETAVALLQGRPVADVFSEAIRQLGRQVLPSQDSGLQ